MPDLQGAITAGFHQNLSISSCTEELLFDQDLHIPVLVPGYFNIFNILYTSYLIGFARRREISRDIDCRCVKIVY
jgi:hypothetical protein